MLPERPDLLRVLSFDDVIVMPGGPLIAPDKVSLDAAFTKTYPLKKPFIGKVKTAEDAIALAQQGLLGILNGQLSFGEQIEAVKRVKRHQAKLLRQPHTVTPDTSVAETRDLQTRNGFSAVPIVDPATHKIIGIVTRGDVAKAADPSDPISSVMVTDLLTVSEQASDSDVQRILQEQMVGQVIVIDDKGQLKGLRTASDFAKRAANPFANLDAHGRLLVGATIGTGYDGQDRLSALLDMGVDVILLDQPYAHSQAVQDMITFVRRQRCEQPITIIAGQVQTADGARALIDAGADVLWTNANDDAVFHDGIRVPAFTALQNVIEAASLLQIPVWVDSGLNATQALKALTAGAAGCLTDYATAPELQQWAQTLAQRIGQAGSADLKSLASQSRLGRLK